MSQIVEKTYVDCTLNQAPIHLGRFFVQHAQDGEETIVIPLRAPFEVAGVKHEVEKAVTFTLSHVHTGPDMVPRISVDWAPRDGGPFPRFEGTVSIDAGEDYDSCAIVLRGTYAPPFGAAGKAFDAVLGRRIARATARELVERIGDFVESAYRETERKKREHAPG